MTDVLHGFSMSDLDSAARIAVAKRAAAYMYDEAWSAAAEALCVSESLRFGDLIIAAMRGIDRGHRSYYASYGMYDNPAANGSQYLRYWSGRLTSPWEERVVDRLALVQVWPLLSMTDRESLVALATYEQYDVAAEALGISYAALILRLRRARKAFRVLWHDWEAPSKTWGRDERKRRGDKLAVASRYDATRRPSRRSRSSGGDNRG